MHFKKLTLKNFQIHKNISIEFKEGVNSIIGETDKGKSAIIRSLNLLLNNQPRAGEKSFLREGSTKPLEIVLEDSEGNILKRKDKTYYLNKETYKAFGNDVPQPILDLYPLTKTNWQRQFDQHYMIFDTPGNVSKTINSIIGLQEQEEILKQIKIELSNEKSESKRLYANKKEQEEKIKELNDVPDLHKKAKKLYKKYEHIEENKKDVEEIEEILFKIKELNKRTQEIPITKLLEETKKNKTNIDSIILKTSVLKSIENTIKCFEIDDDPCIDIKSLKEAEEKTNFLLSSLDADNVFRSFIRKTKKVIDTTKEIEQNILLCKKSVKKQKDEFEKEMKKLGICPLCERKVSDDSFQGIQ